MNRKYSMEYEVPHDTVMLSDIRRKRYAFAGALDDITDRELAEYIMRELIEPLADVLEKERSLMHETALNHASEFWAAVFNDEHLCKLIFKDEKGADHAEHLPLR